MNQKIFVPCHCCRGAGKIELTGVYADTFRIAKSICTDGAYIVANQDAHLFRCKPTALNNRLRRLEELGLLTSRREGRQRQYFLREGESE